MTTVALLPPKLLRHLQFVLGQSQIAVADSWTRLLEIVENTPVGVVVLDPSDERSGTAIELKEMMGAFPSVPILAYVQLAPAAFRAIAEMSKVGLHEVMLYSHEDSAEQLLARLDRVRAGPLTNRMLNALRPKLDLLPIPLARSVQEMFEEPHLYVSANDLAASARLPASLMYRSFDAVDLASPKKVLIAAKLLRAFIYLSDPGNSVQVASRKLGYRKPRVFADQTNAVFGVNPSRVRTRVNEATAMRVLIELCSLNSNLRIRTHEPE